MDLQVAVIITSYNQVDFVREAIDSAINQTVPPSEIIIADDCSTKDNSVEVIKQYFRRYPTLIRPILHKANLGIPRNRNSALAEVTSDYVAVLDGDDRLLPSFIEAHCHALATNSKAGVSYSNRINLFPDGRRKVRTTSPEPSGEILAYIAEGRRGVLRSMVARTELVRQVGGFDARFPYHDGFILSAQLAKITPFVYVPEPLMEKREHPAGLSKHISREEHLRLITDIQVEIKKLIADALPPRDRRRVNRAWAERILRERVMLESIQGRTVSALSRVGRNLMRQPARARQMYKLTREILRLRPSGAAA